MTKALELLQSITEKALKAGADAADAVYAESTSMSTSCRMGKLEDVERSEGADLGLRVLIGKRQANVSTTDLSTDTLDMMIERAVAMAQIAPEDPFCGLAPQDRLLSSIPDLDLDDGSDPSAASLGERAQQAEAAGLEVAGITNSGGAGASFGRGGVTLVTSHGFAGHYTGTSHSVSVSLLAGEGTAMERDYDYSSTRHLSELTNAAEIGRSAGERTMRRLNPRKVPSQAANVMYDPRVSGGLVGHFAGAISGSSVARGTSFLKDKMGEAIFPTGVQIIDDPLRKRGLRSKPFDGEGLGNGLLNLVKDGALQCWLL
ncbi:MAG: PmbA protein, partial [Parvibaculaceae bacterium]